MKTLYLTEKDITTLATVAETIAALDTAFQIQATGRAFINLRSRLKMSGSTLHLMSGAIPGYFGYKAYTSTAGKTQFFFFLFHAETTDLLAIMEADTLGQIRTGAATAFATRLLSNNTATDACVFGAGWQARSQVLGMDTVRNLQRIYVVNKRQERRDAFVQEMQPQIKARLISEVSAEEAVRTSHIVTTITNSKDPVLKGEWLMPGQHINAAGGNSLLRRELDDQAVLRSDRIIVDSIEQAKIEAGEFVGCIESGRRHWEDFTELKDVAGGLKLGRRSPIEITLFKSLGIALEDVVVGKLVYEKAIQRGVGSRLEL